MAATSSTPSKVRHVVLSSPFAALAPEANLVSLGRYALRGVGRAQELFTLDPAVL